MLNIEWSSPGGNWARDQQWWQRLQQCVDTWYLILDSLLTSPGLYTTRNETICNYPELYKSIKDPFRVMCNVAISWMCFIQIIAPPPHSQDTASSIGNPLKYIAADRGRLPHSEPFLSRKVKHWNICFLFMLSNYELYHFRVFALSDQVSRGAHHKLCSPSINTWLRGRDIFIVTILHLHYTWTVLRKLKIWSWHLPASSPCWNHLLLRIHWICNAKPQNLPEAVSV